MRGLESGKDRTASDERRADAPAPAARHTRGGSSYQHSLSARKIKSSGRARSCSDEDLLTSMERLERASHLTSFEDEGRNGRNRAFGGSRETGGVSAQHERAQAGSRKPRFGE